MRWPEPSARTLNALHLTCALPLVALAVWFGLIDRLPFDEGRCSSCGVEGYVIAAHLAAALWLGVVVAAAAAARRQLEQGIAAPGRITLGLLAAAGAFVLASLAWHELFTLPALAAMLVSLLLAPVGTVWWLLAAYAWWRRPAPPGGLQRRASSQLAAAWLCLAVLLPAHYGFVWSDRVEWLVF